MAIEQDTTIQIITTTQIMGIGGVSAIAGSVFTLAGIWLKSYFEAKENKKIRIFEARRKAYAGLIGNLKNGFTDDDFSPKDKNLKEQLDALNRYSVNIDHKLADALLFSGEKLKDKFDIYKQKIFKLKGDVLSDYNNINTVNVQEKLQIRTQEIMEIHNLASKIEDMMRAELEIK